MTFSDETGRSRRSLGVIGALGLETPGSGDILPHEHTTPKAKSDRLQLLTATATNLSPIWGLSMASGLSALIDSVPGIGGQSAADPDGVVHELWAITDPASIQSISDSVASAPVVIADGHHRFETALAYQAERREKSPETPGPLISSWPWWSSCPTINCRSGLSIACSRRTAGRALISRRAGASFVCLHHRSGRRHHRRPDDVRPALWPW